MAEDYSISAKITADTSGFEKGIDKAQKASKNLSKSVSGVIQGLGKNGLVGALGAVGLASSGLTATLGTVVKIAKQVSKTIGECTEAYKTQLIAERALNTAIQNNPFVTGVSSKALQEFASEMQKVSNYGDEELIPMMSNLISLGRTEAETMQIMSVAMDISAGMGISLDSAITQLNATLNGNIGRLGQQNAELKNLTEEELKQGKAIEILGEKFKGLSSATADTSKQLQNIKGDFKEALGQFTLPSSDMWNKFWAGFYEKGIEIINKLDAYMDAEILGKKLSKALEEQVKKIKNEGDKGAYLRGALDLVTDSELQYLNDYLSGLRKANKDQQKILEFVQKEQEARKFVAEEEARFAKLKADRLKQEEEEKRLAEEKAKKEKELAELREKQLKIQKEWEDKLFAIRIENLERQRNLELENEELTEEQKIAISEFYGEQILAMKIKQIEKERDEALNGENITEESREKINLYYENKITQAKQDEEKKRYKAKKEELKEEEKEEKKTLVVIVNLVQNSTKKISDSFKKVADTVKNVFSKIKTIFNKAFDIFKFNPDDALTNLLKIEDTILTFFVETLPKLPAFFSSAVQSVVVLLNNLLSSINWDMVNELINSIVDVVINNAPSIVNNLLSVVINIAQSLLNGIINFVESGGWRMILNMLLTVQKRLEKFVTDNIDEIVNTIISMLPDFIQFLIDSVVSASKTLTKLMKPIMKLITALIDNIVDFLFSDEIFEASIDVTISFIEALAEELLPRIAYLIPKIITKIIGFIVKNLPKLVKGIIDGIIKGFVKTNWIEVIKQCFMGFIDGFKDLFGIHSPSTLFESFGWFMVEGLVNGLKGISEAVMVILQPFANMVTGLFESMFGSLENIVNISFNGITGTVEAINKGISVVISSLSNGLASINNSIANIVNSIANLVSQLTKAIEQINKLNPIGGSGSSSSGGSIWDKVKGTAKKIFDPLGLFATGTNNAPAGLAVVGEAGPELVRFRGGEQVINNRNTQKLLADAGSGKTNNFNVTFNNLQDTSAFAMMNQLKQYNRQMAINGVL